MITLENILDYFESTSGYWMEGLPRDPFFTVPIVTNIVNKCLSLYNGHRPHRLKTEVSGFTKFNCPKISGSFPYRVTGTRGTSVDYYNIDTGLVDIRRTSKKSFLEMCYNHILISDSIETISITDTLFLDLCSANLALALGKTNKSQMVDGLPFSIDSDSMISEATNNLERITSEIRERSFWLNSLRST